MQKVDYIRESKRKLLEEFIDKIWYAIIFRLGESIVNAHNKKELSCYRVNFEEKLKKYFPVELLQFEANPIGRILLTFSFRVPFAITEDTIGKLPRKYFYFKGLNFEYKRLVYDFFYKSRLEVALDVGSEIFYIYVNLNRTDKKFLKNMYLSLRKCIYFILKALID